MISKELHKKIELIRFTAGRKVTESFTGNYESAFKGQGIEFDEVKEYVPGDDFRAIDWNVTARTGHPHIKRYVEERELSILFALDISASSAFKSGGAARLEHSAELVAALALAASRSNDKTGLLLFSDRIEKFVQPAKGSQHTMRLIREIMNTRASGRKTDIGQALSYLGDITGKRWVVFLISDFYTADNEWLKIYRSLGKKFDLIPVRPVVEADRILPDAGLITLTDPETGRRETLDSSSRKVRMRFQQVYSDFENRLKSILSRSGTPLLKLNMDRDWTTQLIQFFFEREQRRGS